MILSGCRAPSLSSISSWHMSHKSKTERPVRPKPLEGSARPLFLYAAPLPARPPRPPSAPQAAKAYLRAGSWSFDRPRERIGRSSWGQRLFRAPLVTVAVIGCCSPEPHRLRYPPQ